MAVVCGGAKQVYELAIATVDDNRRSDPLRPDRLFCYAAEPAVDFCAFDLYGDTVGISIGTLFR